jgi:hypothetical protein
VDGRIETYPLGSAAFRGWLIRAYGDRYPVPVRGGTTRPGVPGRQAVGETLHALTAYAERGPVHDWFVRLGWTDDAVYLDLGTPDRTAVKITAMGWSIMVRPSVMFLRPPGLRPLPRPTRGQGATGIRELARLLGLRREGSMLVIGWLLGCLMPNGPYAVLALTGVQGAGKSITTRILRRSVDPNVAEARAAPRSERDLLIAARNAWILAFENLSEVDQELSDAMCRMATGSGFGARTLYTDLEETLVSVRRPQVMNGIPDLATAADLLDRSVTVVLPRRAEASVLDERELWGRFEEAAPRILGALLDAVSCALRRRDEVKLERTPRMVDFARWVEAAAPALGWKEGAFLAAYVRNQEAGARLAVEADPAGAAVAVLMTERSVWRGTAGALLDALRAQARDDERRSLPTTAHHLSNGLRRLEPALRRLGLEVRRERTRDSRTIEIRKVSRDGS